MLHHKLYHSAAPQWQTEASDTNLFSNLLAKTDYWKYYPTWVNGRATYLHQYFQFFTCQIHASEVFMLIIECFLHFSQTQNLQIRLFAFGEHSSWCKLFNIYLVFLARSLIQQTIWIISLWLTNPFNSSDLPYFLNFLNCRLKQKYVIEKVFKNAKYHDQNLKHKPLSIAMSM